MSDNNGRKPEGFYTLKGYEMIDASSLTTAMEDYLEMIYRLHIDSDVVRIKNLSAALHVKPSSASKMADILKKEGMLVYEKYGRITLTEEGKKRGEYLLFRHDVLHRFLCRINNSQDELAQVEKIEHFLNEKTIYNIKRLLDKINQAPPPNPF